MSYILYCYKAMVRDLKTFLSLYSFERYVFYIYSFAIPYFPMFICSPTSMFHLIKFTFIDKIQFFMSIISGYTKLTIYILIIAIAGTLLSRNYSSSSIRIYFNFSYLKPSLRNRSDIHINK